MSAAGDRQALLVLGMHRAGTSALARVASLLGAGLPAELMPANAGNPSGYWEPTRIVAFNDRLLAHYGTQWDDPFAAFALPPAAEIATAFGDEAAALVDETFAGQRLFVLKDPRCSLLAEFWRSVLEERGIACKPVVVMRPYEEVAASLQRRDGADPRASTLLYVGYALACIAFGERRDAPFVTYAQLLQDWRGTMHRVAASTELHWPASPDAVAGDIEGFLQPASPPPAGFAVAPDVRAWAGQAWDWIAARADGRAPGVGLAPVSEAMAGLAARVGPVLSERTRRHAEADDLGRVVAERDRVHALFEASQADLAEAASARDTATAERDRVHDMFEASQAELARTAAERDRVHALFEASQADLARTAAALTETTAERDRAHALFEESQATLATTAAARDEAVAARDQAQHALDAAAAARDHLEREHQVLCGLHEAALQTVHERDLQLGRLERDVDRLRAELDTMLRSHSWRLTRPLRGARRLVDRLATRGAGTMARTDAGPAMHVRTPPAAVHDARAEAPEAPGTAVPPGLHAFLEQAFGRRRADEVLAGITAYRLPFDGAEIREPARTSCDPGEAVERMATLAALPAAGRGGEPDVSIVVPVYNQLRFTLACLDSLLRHRTRYRFEILVGDDASTDATADAFAVPVAGVRHVRHDGNLGFVRNCNATAAHARGRHVVLLNNDTIVLPGWLDELVGTLDRDPAIGLAGSKLVFPDGRLQECGAIVWRDGSAWNFGRNDDPRRPEYSYLRDVDYVSGASIAVPRSLWQQLGGFDERFVPAYAEDADLAFRIRAAGLRTVVQPLSQLLHFEGVSSGTDLAQGAKAYQVRNLERLRERWADVLAHHRDNAERPDLEKERDVRRRVLFVDHCTPTPHEDAGSRVAWEVMAAFRAHGFKVTFVPEDNFAHMGEDTHALQRLGVEAIYHPAYSRMPQFLEARSDPFDVVFLHRYGVGHAHLAAMRNRYPGAKIVFLNADMHHLREMRAAELAGDPQAMVAARRTREHELAVACGADLALVHSEVELALLREACPGASVALFPLVHDPVDRPAPLAAREGVCFVGGFRHPPNADGIAWFAREAWPLVVAERPGATLHVAGSHVTPEVEALGSLPNVVVHGYVADIGAFLDARRVSVAPLRYGAGAKGKVAESLAHGLPTVCTPIAIEGMALSPGGNVLVGEDPASLAAHVISLLGDDARWQALSGAGLRYAAEVTSRARAHARVGQLLDVLGIRD